MSLDDVKTIAGAMAVGAAGLTFILENADLHSRFLHYLQTVEDAPPEIQNITSEQMLEDINAAMRNITLLGDTLECQIHAVMAEQIFTDILQHRPPEH